MNDLSLLSKEVTEALLATPEYIRYKELLTKLKEQPELHQQVNEMREKNFKIQYTYAEDALDMIDALTNEYDDVINIELVGQFMEAEASLCKLVQNFYTSVISELEFE